jgi:hypothetical protein
MNDSCTITEDFTPEQCGYVKKLEVSLIQRKEYFSERTFENKVAFFVITLRCSMPRDRDLKLCYFYFDPKRMGHVAIRDFDLAQYSTQTINVVSPKIQKKYGIKVVSKKRVSAHKANAMIRNKECLPDVINELGEVGEVTVL